MPLDFFVERKNTVVGSECSFYEMEILANRFYQGSRFWIAFEKIRNCLPCE